MTVEEVLAEIWRMTPEDQARIREAVAGVETTNGAGPGQVDDAWLAWDELLDGLVVAGRSDLSATIDDALYGPGQ